MPWSSAPAHLRGVSASDMTLSARVSQRSSDEDASVTNRRISPIINASTQMAKHMARRSRSSYGGSSPAAVVALASFAKWMAVLVVPVDADLRAAGFLGLDLFWGRTIGVVRVGRPVASAGAVAPAASYLSRLRAHFLHKRMGKFKLR